MICQGMGATIQAVVSHAAIRKEVVHEDGTHLVDSVSLGLAVVHLAVTDVLVVGSVGEGDSDEGRAACGPSLALLVIVDLQASKACCSIRGVHG